jgi:hypothetical protein
MSALEALKLIAPTVHLERNGGKGERGEGRLREGRAAVLDALANSARGGEEVVARSIPSP